MDIEDQLSVDLNLSAQIARSTHLLVSQEYPEDLKATAAHLCGALSLVLFSMSKPGTSMNCIPGIAEAMKSILIRIEKLDADSALK
ncbi:hypothetical protein [Magnetospirillum sulfuroxidans]|uniref:DUF3077 domain-containing protein n=1 Tax=Magnetospirillum sulfuroxidans TaxID=611300 RepID=A0ABS5ICQ4_9PROT|nr:hypothetical protein [Magnetospirillum sulfuroxidans]MBR9972109.1 hypothetical protein [Magnetospirillum sulfuroxidans]